MNKDKCTLCNDLKIVFFMGTWHDCPYCTKGEEPRG